MYKLGITGDMGTGKSTSAKFFLKKGAVIFDADEEAKKHLLSHIELQNQIIEKFGPQVTVGNQLDLFRLSEFIFSSKKHQIPLNNII